jgi:hypothetical protein
VDECKPLPGLLLPKLVAGKRQELEPQVVVLGVNVQQPLVVAGGVPSFRA